VFVRYHHCFGVWDGRLSFLHGRDLSGPIKIEALEGAPRRVVGVQRILFCIVNIGGLGVGLVGSSGLYVIAEGEVRGENKGLHVWRRRHEGRSKLEAAAAAVDMSSYSIQRVVLSRIQMPLW
jgi:hypothetical protein